MLVLDVNAWTPMVDWENSSCCLLFRWRQFMNFVNMHAKEKRYEWYFYQYDVKPFKRC